MCIRDRQKQRLKFAYEETGASVKNDKDMEKLNQMDTDGVNSVSYTHLDVYKRQELFHGHYRSERHSDRGVREDVSTGTT